MINGNVLSEEIILDCKGIMYKYVKDGTNVSVYSTHMKRDEGKWHRWPYTGVIEENKHFLKSLEEVETIIDGYKVTSKSKKIEQPVPLTSAYPSPRIDWGSQTTQEPRTHQR